ncbi:ABC transporter permease [Paracoccus sp. P2]|uniref:Transport permease protein n=2 Tax=Paracoccus pantotrophus TaxID=82367 RepID=A0A454NQL4_PARPN|nr:ABC transporter permease [Paracoccus pantotrophus]MDF3856605.1 ABC transporter permease [Paracoccus pantotrophus]QFG36609.1 sugar ABC transporter permease [Paracoccus pantotrophus]QFG38688.1 sugar ABC transporter permease [Paracoccus pantotrophus]QLH16446.1 ABC transporter permease [Paracoccus pantotrophus]QLH16996.1 ABC transporter permease [Paracoccus pantotrophus]
MPRTVVALMLREMATSYGRSAGGYVWAVLEPVLGVALLSVLFSMALRSPGLGSNFPLFYATGYLPFAMFTDLANKTAASIRFSRPLLAYPSVTFLDALLARVVLNALTHVAVIAIVIGGIFLAYQLPGPVDMPSVFEALLLVALLGTGVGVLNCYLMNAFPVWERVWHILTRPLFLISGVIFLYDMMPVQAQNLLWYNPLIHCTGLMRRGFYPTYEAGYLSQAYVVALALALMLAGLALLERNHRKLLER